ncbi:MAG: 30S ribosomal protein S27e [Nanoarchaeota archaeon]
MNKSEFLQVLCPKCRSLRIIYGKSSIRIKCSKCNYLLIKSSGGKAKIRARIKEVLR